MCVIRNKLAKFAQVATLVLTLTFTFSCSGGDDDGPNSGGNSGGGSCNISSYKSKKMPGGKTWMLENLNCNVAGSECYEKEESYCKKYGRLYTWEAAKKACSGDWHLPTDDEWEALVTAVGGASTAGTKLKATSDWNEGGNGTDEFGFSALPGGYGISDGYFFNVGNYGSWWSSSTESSSYYVYIIRMHYYFENVSLSISDKGSLLSVRCLQD
jgi:uncharacterized protein (TIGR02145 family)